jgi:hypothetical protein
MKLKFFLFASLLFLAGVAHADDRGRLGTSDASLSISSWSAPSWSTGTVVTIASTTTRVCLSDVSALSTNTFTTRILTEGTTAYELTNSTAAFPVSKTWGTNTPLCGATGQRIFISVSCSGCTPDINYQYFWAQ